MRIVRGSRGKNVKMAQLFVEEKGDFFLDYGKNAIAHGTFDRAGVIDRVYVMDRFSTPLLSALTHLTPMARTDCATTMYIDGNFSHDEVEILKRWAEDFPRMSLTISEQTITEVIEIING